MLDYRRISLFSIYLLLHTIGSSAAPQLDFPLACTLDKDCWVANYVDVAPETGVVSDFHCRSRSYDKHKGVDIAIADWRSMIEGVDVLAAAAGTVLRLRDGIPDNLLSAEKRLKIFKNNMGCGNGVIIDHGQGWQTNYCHLKKSSLKVVKGEKVEAGQKIAEVGHSGFTEFPHLHIGVMRNGQVIDPFTGRSNSEGCNGSEKSLWRESVSLHYEPVSIYANGFKDAIPDFASIGKDASSLVTLSTAAPALTYWVALLGVAKNDHVEMQIRDPDGRIYAETTKLQPQDRARQFYFIGKRNRSQKLLNGTYTANTRLTRTLANGESIVREMSQKLVVK